MGGFYEEETGVVTSDNNNKGLYGDSLLGTDAVSGYAEEWANNPEDVLVSIQAGGNGVDEYSALHWAAKAAAVSIPGAVTYENLALNNDVGTGADQVAQGDHGHDESDITFTVATATNGTYQIDGTDYLLLLDGTTNNVTGKLPTAVGITGRKYAFKCINDTQTCSVSTFDAESIDGSTADIPLSLHETITVISDGSDWWII